MRVVDEGLLIGGKREVELTRVGSELSADLLGALSSFPCLSAGRQSVSSTLALLPFQRSRAR